jgi:RND family efflux transporter MFP subunit
MSERAFARLWRTALLACAPLVIAGCNEADAKPAAPYPAVLTTVIHPEPDAPLTRRAPIAPAARLRLGFAAAGTIGEVNVKMGDKVKKGQILARLQDSGAGAMLQAANAQRMKALRDQQQAQSLVHSGSLATSQGDDALSNLRVASANASAAASAINLRVLYAPLDGTVLERAAEPGETVGPGVPVVVLDNTDRLVVKVGLTERELPRVAPQQNVVLLPEGSDSHLKATVASVAGSPREDGLYSVEVEPAPPPPGLRPLALGTMVTVQFENLSKTTAIHVPLDALVDRGGKTWAFVVTPTSARTESREPLATVKLRELEVDRADDKDVLVRRGLLDGERIVREGVYFLEADQTVRLLD